MSTVRSALFLGKSFSMGCPSLMVNLIYVTVEKRGDPIVDEIL